VRLSLEVDVDAAGLPLTSVRSSLHATATEDTPNGMKIRLNPGERADRDFLLRMKLGSADAVSTALAVRPDEDEQGGTFALTVLPPTRQPQRHGRDVVLVLDRSGSMGGWKMVAARRAAARIVDTLNSGDRFAVLAFDFQTDTPPGQADTLVEATDRNRFRAVEFLAGVDARGGTEMLAPLRKAADLLHETTERERILVLVTDGQVGNEDQLLRELAPKLTGVRVHTVGIDRAVNEGFLTRLAGPQGRSELVESEDRLDEAMDNIHRRIGTPLVTGLTVTQDGLAVDLSTVAPTPLPDLYPGAPVVVMGRYTGSPDGSVVVSGLPDWRTPVTATKSDNPALAALWARALIRDLEDAYLTESAKVPLEEQIVATSLKYGVLSRFTAFVAVDNRVVNEGGKTHRVTQPVDLPSGWETPQAPGMARSMAVPASMPSFAAAPKFGTADTSRSLTTNPAADYGSGYGGAPAPGISAGAPGQYQPPVAPPPHKKISRPVPLPIPPSDGKAVANFAAEELARLRGSAGEDVWLRAGLLTALSERIRVQLAVWERSNEPQDARRTLGTLSGELAVPTAEPAEVDRRWDEVIATLELLAAGGGARARRSFWKR
jgi:Ca-activated chloride channel family protein